MKPINFTIIKLTIGFIVGIIIGYLKPCSINTAIILVVCLIIALLISKLFLNKSSKTIYFGVIAYCTIIFIGILTVSVHNEKEYSNHYTHFLNNKQTNTLITFRINKVLKSNLYYNKYIIDILFINSQNASGKSILNIKKDTLNSTLKIDDIVTVSSLFKTIKKTLNPQQFNYKAYLKKHYIYHQITSNNSSLYKHKKKTHSLFGHVEKLRKHIENQLKNYHFMPDELSIVNAMILGQRQNINPVIYDNYTKAGAIHILAVSGLHIGIILMLITPFAQLLDYFKHNSILKILFTLGVLWSFAIIAGLSPSVTRATTMFSIITIGMHIKRPVNTYNSIAISVFVLLLFKPLFLFDLGFQLSYVAVISIISIQPILQKLWNPKWIVLKKLWQVLTVSVSAQLGVLPLSLFYFHQFPGLFFLSNLVIIPCLGFIIGLGILVILLAILNSLPEFIANFYASLINLLNQFIKWIAQQNEFIFIDIPFNTIQLITSYLLIIALTKVCRQLNYNRLLFLLIAIVLFQSNFIEHKLHLKSNEFIIFHKNKTTVIAKKKNRFLAFYSNSDVSKIKRSFRNYTIAHRINKITKSSLDPIFKIKNRYLLVIDSTGVYNVKQFCPDYILLTNTPKINLNRIIDSIKPLTIIADGSNHKSQILKWKKSCKEKKIPFHYTGEKGAFILKCN